MSPKATEGGRSQLPRRWPIPHQLPPPIATRSPPPQGEVPGSRTPPAKSPRKRGPRLFPPSTIIAPAPLAPPRQMMRRSGR
ncbi:hypothetical protein CFHF_12460 [Caulobacter flavus]|uniref:Uncharacterized protein n=1 Tax=Caulobacter flavus TaxID=1679497 RepID=A0A2N5CT20_9CAUL|nr:hypothetical protein C1707_24405 [Caulobacter flavus]PLR14784.1 hypothetical protein CFHF_12460 [Caulobacter flavus]